MTRWIATGRLGSEYAAFAMDDARIMSKMCGADEAEALHGLPVDTDLIVRIGDGSPKSVPCAILPEHGMALPVITQDDPPDILDPWMRVWIAGFLARHKHWDGVIWAIDADVSYWIHVSADEIVSFTSFLTPRLVATFKGADKPAKQALTDTMSRPEQLASHLRQAELSGDSRAITGHLLGAELAAARPYWLGQHMALITLDKNAPGYAAVLEMQGVPGSSNTSADVLEDGLAALGKALGLHNQG